MSGTEERFAERRADAEYLRSIARGLSYNVKGEAVRKHRLNEIAMRIDTGFYSAAWPFHGQVERAPVSEPKFITFTGADEHTDIERMVSLSKKYPIEWGILFSPKRQGAGRYPPLDFAERLTRRGGLRLAAHLCGDHARAALKGIWPLAFGGFDRVQINTTEGHINVAAVHEWAARKGMRAILQCRSASFPPTTHVAWLFDQSGGRGIEPGAWPKSHATSQCGYAGGIGPDNVLDVLSRIDSTDFWIDMESKVRDANDRFDLDAVERVCQAVWPPNGGGLTDCDMDEDESR